MRGAALLDSLFPIPITWNHHTRHGVLDQFVKENVQREPSEAARLQSSIAVRIAYCVFIRSKSKSKKEMTFESFRSYWDEQVKTTDILTEVFQAVRKCLVNRNILLIVDEAAKTGVPKLVRNMLYTHIAQYPNDRMVISSLQPDQLKENPSDFNLHWVQLRPTSREDLLTVRNTSVRWLDNVSITDEQREQQKKRALYLFEMTGNNWRAKFDLFNKIKKRPTGLAMTNEMLMDVTQGLVKTLKTISKHFVRGNEWVPAVDKLLVWTILQRKVCCTHFIMPIHPFQHVNPPRSS